MNTFPFGIQSRRSGRSYAWMPSPLEEKCLSHMDDDENWSKILGYERPAPSEPQGWKPFAKIFRINFALFFVVLGITFPGIVIGSGGTLSDLAEYAVGGSIIVLGASLGLAGFVTHLYRKTWNRRAAELNRVDEVEPS